MRLVKAATLLGELAFLAIGFATGGPVDAQIRAIALVVAVVVGGAALFVVVCLVVALVQQRQPPFKV